MTFMKFFYLFIFVFIANSSFAIMAKCDTTEVNKINDEILEMVYDQPSKGLVMAIANERQANICSHDIGAIRAIIRQGIAYEMLAQNTNSINAYKRALELSKKIKYEKGVASCYNNIGLIYWNESKYNQALQNYFKALDFFEKKQNYLEIAKVADNIGLIYLEIYNYPKANFWFQKSLKNHKLGGATSEIYNLYSNLSILMENMGKTDSVEYFFNLAFEGYTKDNDIFGLIILKNHESNSHIANKAFQKALKSSEEARKMSLNIENNLSYLTASIDYINARIEIGLEPLQEKELLELIGLAKNYDNPRFLSILYGQMSNVKALQGQVEESKKFNKMSLSESNRYIEIKQNENTAKMQAIYEVNEQKLKSENLVKEKRTIIEKNAVKQRFYTYLILGLIVLILFIITISVLFVSRRNLKQRIIKERAIFDAKSSERKRISYDLHDNLGSQLSFMVSNLEILQEEVKSNKRIDSSYEMAQESIKSLRESIWMLNQNEISCTELESKIMELSQKFLNSTEIAFKINFDCDGNDKIESEKAYHLFKIYQEVLNNLFKHSKALNFEVNFKQVENKFYFSMKDDGIGVDLESLNSGQYGLESIKERVRKINGKIKISSFANKGFEIVIDFEK